MPAKIPRSANGVERRGSGAEAVYPKWLFGYTCRVKELFFKDFTSRFDANGSYVCECGKVHKLQTRTTLVARNALESAADLLGQSYGRNAKVWVLSDRNTEAAAGARWKASLKGVQLFERVLEGTPKIDPTTELVAELEADVSGRAPKLLVAVGSGVISDLVKRVSLLSGVPNWCVATAPSVDAYGSATASIRVNDFHSATPAQVSEVIVADLDVIEKAPRTMFLAGLGDLLAKFIACLDWSLSRIVTGEHYCPVVSAVALGSARSALDAGRALDEDRAASASALMDAALSSGFAMQATGGSRSAASAEHTIVHFLETAHAAQNEKLDLHGILAGVASRMVLFAYEPFYERLEGFQPDIQRRLAAFDREPPWEKTVEPALAPYMGKVREEMSGRTLDRGALVGRLEAFVARRAEILDLSRSVLKELRQATGLLERMDYPFSFKALDMQPDLVSLPFRNIRLLRRRYSTFDLAYELGLEEILREAGNKYVGTGGL
jgi:glycerol-1-phosphate dehydrogenase [NAD(P)+]